MKHHIALYNGRAVPMDYLAPSKEFQFACMRIQDNGASGYVFTPNGQVYKITQGKRLAILLKDETQKAAAFAELAKLQ
jgi:hypothetical protein